MEAVELLGQADAAFLWPIDTLNAAMLAQAPRLKWISVAGAGLDRIDLTACAQRGIPVRSAADATCEPTADLVMALLLGAARQVSRMDVFVRTAWGADSSAPMGLDVHHRTLGIIGLGRIGQAVARRAQGFSMKILHHTKPPYDVDAAERLSAQAVDLHQLLQQSDFVVIQTPLTTETRHLIDREALAQMRPTAVLVNAGRGGLVDEDALVDALDRGQIAHAALDVFEDEPHVNPRLLACEKVLLTPHIGTATAATRRDMALKAVRNLAAMIA